MLRCFHAAVLVAGAAGYFSFQNKIPNGGEVPCYAGATGCQEGTFCSGVGHNSCMGGDARNPFGLDFKAASFDWTVVCQQDSDEDGFTNGEELGDPCCTWQEGWDPAFPALSHPGVATVFPATRDDFPNCGGDEPSEPPTEKDVPYGFNPWEEQRNMSFIIDSYELPRVETTYVDFRFNFNDESHDIFHIVFGFAIVDLPIQLHHFVVSGCSEKVPEHEVGKPKFWNECEQMLGGFAGWAPGATLWPLEKHVGVPIGRGVGIVGINIEVHYTDAQRVGHALFSRDGINMFYTPTLRPAQSLSMQVINLPHEPDMIIPPGKDRFFIARTCTVRQFRDFECTDFHADIANVAQALSSPNIHDCESARAWCDNGVEEFASLMRDLCAKTCGFCQARDDGEPESRNLSNSFYHAHLLGREMYQTQYSERGEEDLESQRKWDFNYQAQFPLKDKTVTSGDVMSGLCVFNSTGRDDGTPLGLSTYEEMCFVMTNVNYPMPSDSSASYMQMHFCVGGVIWTGELNDGEDPKTDGRGFLENHPWHEGEQIFLAGGDGGREGGDEEGTGTICERYYGLFKMGCSEGTDQNSWDMNECDKFWTEDQWRGLEKHKAETCLGMAHPYANCMEEKCGDTQKWWNELSEFYEGTRNMDEIVACTDDETDCKCRLHGDWNMCHHEEADGACRGFCDGLEGNPCDTYGDSCQCWERYNMETYQYDYCNGDGPTYSDRCDGYCERHQGGGGSCSRRASIPKWMAEMYGAKYC